MSDYHERMRAYERRQRAVKMADTYLKKAVDLHHAMLHTMADLGPDHWLDQLLETALIVATDIIELLPDHYFSESQLENVLGLELSLADSKYNLSDTADELVEKLTKALATRRDGVKTNELIAKLENIEGRTPEEAELFKAKAAELRARE